MTNVFEGLKVADFSLVITGAYISRCLADYGATVIHVESQKHVDPLRLSAPFKDGKTNFDKSGYFAIYNTSKYSLALNLNHANSSQVVKRLVDWCDVIVENLSPGVMQRWGLDYETVKEIKPDVVYISSSNLGQYGPCAKYSSYGSALVSLAGFSNLTGWPDREPSQPYGAHTDILAPRFGTAALFAALDYRRRTGEGQYIDLSQLEASLQFLSVPFLNYSASGTVATRQGNFSPDAAPHNAYRCIGPDKWCVIAVETEEEWLWFSGAIDRSSWVNDTKFATLRGRKENETELDKLVEDWTSRRTAEDVMILLQKAGVAAGIVATGEDISNDPQHAHREYFHALDHPEIGPFKFPDHPYKLSKTPAEISTSPLMGQHNEIVIKDILGFTEEEYVNLLVAQALE